MLGGELTFIGIDEDGPQLYSVSPVAICTGYKAWAAGAKHTEANTALEKYKNEIGNSDYTAPCEMALGTLSTALAVELKASELEMAVIKAGAEKFTLLTDDQVDALLVGLA